MSLNQLDGIQADVLVIGAGAAGLLAALSAADAGARVLLACKMPVGGLSNSAIMQRWITRVGPEAVDDLVFEIVYAGGFLSDQRLAGRFAREAVTRIPRLLEYGVRMSADGDGPPNRAGHFVVEPVSGRRSAHAFTHPLWEAVAKPDVQVLENAAVVDLLVEEGRVVGAVAADLERMALRPIAAGATVLATGGGAAAYARNDNAPGTTGDGFALAYRAGAELINLECVSFWYQQERLQEMLAHPEAAADLDPAKVNDDGRCHYFMGGVRIDETTATSLPGLYAAGEVTGGLFGAARLGGAAIGEAVVFGSIAGEQAAAWAGEHGALEAVASASEVVTSIGSGGSEAPDAFKNALGDLLWRQAGAFKSADSLQAGRAKLADLRDGLKGLAAHDGKALQMVLEARNICDWAECLLAASLARAETRGNYWRLDHLQPDQEAGLANIVVRRTETGPKIERRPVPMTELDEPTQPPIAPGCFGYVRK